MTDSAGRCFPRSRSWSEGVKGKRIAVFGLSSSQRLTTCATRLQLILFVAWSERGATVVAYDPVAR